MKGNNKKRCDAPPLISASRCAGPVTHFFTESHDQRWDTWDKKLKSKLQRHRWELGTSRKESILSPFAREAVVKFIKNLEETLGEADPTHKGYLQLPADTKANHYVDFETQATESHHGCHCVYDYFCRIWREKFPKLILPQSVRWVSLGFLELTLFNSRSNARCVTATGISGKTKI